MQQFGNKYSDAKLSQMKMWLQDMSEKGTPKYYEVYVDDTVVVGRTRNLDEFDDHQHYMDQDSRVVKVFIYNTEQTHRYKQYIYEIKDQSQQKTKKENSLDGVEIDQRISLEKERWDMQRLREKLEETQQQLREAEEYMEKLKLTNKTLREELEQSSGKKLWVRLAEKAIDNPLMMLKVGQLAGVIPKGGKDQSLDGTESAGKDDASGKKEEQPEEEQEEESSEITQAQWQVLEALQKADSKLNEEDLERLGQLMGRLTENPTLIIVVNDLIKNNTEK